MTKRDYEHLVQAVIKLAKEFEDYDYEMTFAIISTYLQEAYENFDRDKFLIKCFCEWDKQKEVKK